MLLDDAVQDTWLKIQTSLESKTGEVSHVHAWLKKIAHNTAIDCYRRRQPLALLEHYNDISDNGHTIDHVDFRIDVDRAYRRLMVLLPKTARGQRQRAILHYVVAGNRSREIAQLLGISESLVSKTVKQLGNMVRGIEQAYGHLTRRLSERQRRILHLAEEGKQGHNIALRLGLSDSLVTKELQHIRKELEALLHTPQANGGGNTRPSQVASRESRQVVQET